MGRIKTLIIVSVLMLCSCGDLFKNESLTFTKTPYCRKEIRIDGYYYALDQDSFCTFFLLYQNGIAIHPFSNTSQSKCEDEFLNGNYIKNIKTLDWAWGLFEVSQDTLKTEFLRSYGIPKVSSVIHSYKIVNDTTIKLLKIYFSSSGSLIETTKQTFHFKAFTPKPDSINIWIP